MYWRFLASTTLSAAAALLLTGTACAQTDPYNALARDIFKELIEINTTESVGNVTTASEAMAQRLLAADGVYTSAAGLPTYVIGAIAIDKDNIRAHGKDENLGVESFYRGNEFFYRYLKTITSH